jgi:ribosomal protein S18 acetylase RimI-like enzyme
VKTESRERLVTRQASPADLDEVVSMLEEAARWMVRQGIEGWTPDGFSRERIGFLIESGEIYLAVLDRRPAGTFALQWPDRETWGDVPDDAGYVHGLAIRREFAGTGLGREMLARAGRMVSRSRREYLRLDCVADNEALNEYYRRAGFARRGSAVVRGLAVTLYEKRVGVSGAG